MDDHIIIRPTEANDCLWMREVMRKWCRSESVVIRKTKYEPAEMNGFIALLNDEKAGLVILRYDETLCEIMSLTVSGIHPQISSQLISSAIEGTKKNNSERMILVATNDNTNALHFYQNIRFRLHKLRVGIVEKSRNMKPQIPLVGNYHIPIRDEIELEMIL